MSTPRGKWIPSEEMGKEMVPARVLERSRVLLNLAWKGSNQASRAVDPDIDPLGDVVHHHQIPRDIDQFQRDGQAHLRPFLPHHQKPEDHRQEEQPAICNAEFFMRSPLGRVDRLSGGRTTKRPAPDYSLVNKVCKTLFRVVESRPRVNRPLMATEMRPVSSETTTTAASASSDNPRAARWRNRNSC